MPTNSRRSPLRAAVPWVLVVLSVCWVAFHATPRSVRAEYGLVPSVDQFSYDQWHTDLELVRTPEGQAELTVTETIVARFPDHDQNKGIVRGIPVHLNAWFKDVRVRDADGNDVPYTEEFDDEARMAYILTGTDDHVHGLQTYVIEYTIEAGMFRDVGGENVELYWNLLPLDSAQAIDDFSATIRIDPALSEDLTGQTTCYQGRYGGTDTCVLDEQVEADGSVVFSFASGPRKPGDGVTVGIGIDDGAVNGLTDEADAPTATQLRFQHLTGWQVGLGLFVAAMAIAVAASGMWSRHVARTRIKPPTDIGPTPGVPADLPPPVAAAILQAADAEVIDKGNTAAAQITRLAVHGVIRFDSDAHSVRVRLIDPGRAGHELDRDTVTLLFPDLTPGTVAVVPQESQSFGKAMAKIVDDGKASAIRQGHLTRMKFRLIDAVLGAITLALFIIGLGLLITSYIWGVDDSWTMAVIAGGGIALITAITTSPFVNPAAVPTPQGGLAYRQIQGARLYLQHSAPGTDNVHVQEQLLPYAVLFSVDEQWRKQLESGYRLTGIEPAWLSGGTTDLTHRWTSIRNVIHKSSTYTPESSGGSTGSGGGGFSGGGGGGGFSGGR